MALITIRCHDLERLHYAERAVRSFLKEAEQKPEMWADHQFRHRMYVVGYFGCLPDGETNYGDSKATVCIWGTKDKLSVSVGE